MSVTPLPRQPSVAPAESKQASCRGSVAGAKRQRSAAECSYGKHAGPKTPEENTRSAGQGDHKATARLFLHIIVAKMGVFGTYVKPGITVVMQLVESGVGSGGGLLLRYSGPRGQRQVLDDGLHLSTEIGIEAEIYRAGNVK